LPALNGRGLYLGEYIYNISISGYKSTEDSRISKKRAQTIVVITRSIYANELQGIVSSNIYRKIDGFPFMCVYHKISIFNMKISYLISFH
jgi:hypothetical protein